MPYHVLHLIRPPVARLAHTVLPRLPGPLHRFAYRTGDRARRLFWKLSGHRARGVRIIACDAEGRVLLVRHSYGSGEWMAPGGGVKRGESEVDTAIRELAEETGCQLLDAQRIEVPHFDPFHRDADVTIIVGLVLGTPVVDNRELVEAAFVDPHDLPANLSDHTEEMLPIWTLGAHARLGLIPGGRRSRT